MNENAKLFNDDGLIQKCKNESKAQAIYYLQFDCVDERTNEGRECCLRVSE